MITIPWPQIQPVTAVIDVERIRSAWSGKLHSLKKLKFHYILEKNFKNMFAKKVVFI